MMKYLIVLCCLFPLSIMGQTVILMHNVDKDEDIEHGPGKTFHNGTVFGYGMHFGPSENGGATLKSTGSIHLQSGNYSKLELNKVVALGLIQMLDFSSYKIDLSDGHHIAPSTLTLKRERFWHLDYSFTPFLRFNYAWKRGDHLGFYTDFGFNAGYAFLTRHVYLIDERSSPTGNADFLRITERNLNYINKIHLSPVFKIGLRNLVLYSRYRLTNLFKENTNGYQPLELPRFTAGIQFINH